MKQYIKPELKMSLFVTENIITTSGITDKVSGETGGSNYYSVEASKLDWN